MLGFRVVLCGCCGRPITLDCSRLRVEALMAPLAAWTWSALGVPHVIGERDTPEDLALIACSASCAGHLNRLLPRWDGTAVYYTEHLPDVQVALTSLDHSTSASKLVKPLTRMWS